MNSYRGVALSECHHSCVCIPEGFRGMLPILGRVLHKTDSLQVMSFFPLFYIPEHLICLHCHIFFLFSHLGISIRNHLEINMCRGLYVYIIIYFWSKTPTPRHSGSLGSHSPHLCWGKGLCVRGCFSKGETRLYQFCPCVARQEGWGRTPVPGEISTGRMHYLYGTMEW